MFGLDTISSWFLATSSGSMILNLLLVPFQVIITELAAFICYAKISTGQNWICQETWYFKPPHVNNNGEEKLKSWGIIISHILLRMIKIESHLYCNALFLYFFKHRPLCFFVIHITWPGLTGFRANHTLAVFAGITLRCNQLSNHYLGGNQWWIQTHWSRWSCQKMGRKEIQTKHELWQDEQSNEVSCKVFIFFQSYIT